MKNYYIILGNGFTLDFLSHLEKEQISQIDVSNLFRMGECVPWPGNGRPGFLSHKHCPNLWALGARYNLSVENAAELIDNIITCANIFNNLKVDLRKNDKIIHINAYIELVSYLKSLFVFFNDKIDVDNVNLESWGLLSFIDKINKDKEVKKINIITYNYDIFLERLLKRYGIPFCIEPFESNKEKISIFKPHGSISFEYKVDPQDKTAFQINYSYDNDEMSLKQFELKYENIDVLKSRHAIIPPSGDPSRFLNYKWSAEIQKSINDALSRNTDKDEIVIFGISYCHVDRVEIDRILSQFTRSVSNLSVIDPSPSKVFNAVVTTLFDNVIFYSNSSHLLNII